MVSAKAEVGVKFSKIGGAIGFAPAQTTAVYENAYASGQVFFNGVAKFAGQYSISFSYRQHHRLVRGQPYPTAAALSKPARHWSPCKTHEFLKATHDDLSASG